MICRVGRSVTLILLSVQFFVVTAKGAEHDLSFLDEQIQALQGDPQVFYPTTSYIELSRKDLRQFLAQLHRAGQTASPKSVMSWYSDSADKSELIEDMGKRDYLGKFLGLIFLENYPVRFPEYNKVRQILQDMIERSKSRARPLTFNDLIKPLAEEFIYQNDFNNNKRVDIAHALSVYLRMQGDLQAYSILRELELRVFWAAALVRGDANTTGWKSQVATNTNGSVKKIYRMRGHVVSEVEFQEGSQLLGDYIKEAAAALLAVHPDFKNQVSGLKLGCSIALESLGRRVAKVKKR